MPVVFDDIDSLLDSAISWAKNSNHGCLYGFSDDEGAISLRIQNVRHHERLYKSICIMNITIPEKRQQNRYYTNLLRSLDDLNIYGIRWHDSVQNEILVARHLKLGYFEKGGSFYTIIGKPYVDKTEIKNEDPPQININQKKTNNSKIRLGGGFSRLL